MAAAPVLQLTQWGMRGGEDLDALRTEFAASHVIRLPGLFDASLVRGVVRILDQASWVTHQDGDIAREVLPEGLQSSAAGEFVCNTPAFLRAIRRITGCNEIVKFHGRVYRMAPGTDHYDSWHGDLGNDRLIGLSVNLGPRPYRGGVFQFRRVDGDTILGELPNIVPGDAILFRLSEAFVHRVTPMEGTEPKTAFAGWFKSGRSDYFAPLRRAATGP